MKMTVEVARVIQSLPAVTLSIATPRTCVRTIFSHQVKRYTCMYLVTIGCVLGNWPTKFNSVSESFPTVICGFSCFVDVVCDCNMES